MKRRSPSRVVVRGFCSRPEEQHPCRRRRYHSFIMMCIVTFLTILPLFFVFLFPNYYYYYSTTTSISQQLPHYLLSSSTHAAYNRSFCSLGDKNDSARLTEFEEEVCCLMNNDCLRETARRIARVWPHKPWQGWCTPSSSSSGFLWLIKVPKSASSTMAGLVLRIAHRKQCSIVQWQHGSARQQQQQRNLSATFHKDRQNILLVAPIRNPSHRAMSDLYFHRVSLQPNHQQQQQQQQRRQQPSDSFIVKGLEQIQANYITEYTRLWPSSSSNTDSNTDAKKKQKKFNHQNNSTEQSPQRDSPHQSTVEIVESILQNYDFLFLVEELSQSMLVFAWLTGLTVGDVMVASSKQSGTWYSQTQNCVRLIPPQLTPAIQDYFEESSLSSVALSYNPRHSSSSSSSSQNWKRKHVQDRLLHAAVQESLHKTIAQHIGRDRMKQALQRWYHLSTYLQMVCVNETHWPCSSTGQLQLELAHQSCYTRDFGCGHACYDRHIGNSNNSSSNLTSSSILSKYLTGTVDVLWN